MATILYRKSPDIDWESEIKAATPFFTCINNRTLCKNDLVIGRYSVLPFYKELEQDLSYNGCKLINSYAQHQYIANMDWYEDLYPKFTMHSWFADYHEFPTDEEFPVIVKGRTNSRKHRWNQDFYAANKSDAISIMSRLMDDPLIHDQGIVYRKYVPLHTFGIGINGVRWSNEWRFFFYKDTLLSCGYYWSSAEPEIVAKAVLSPDCVAFAQKCAKVLAKKLNFYVVDVAEKKEGGFILIEVNDAQQSGLSECIADNIYRNLNECLAKEKVG